MLERYCQNNEIVPKLLPYNVVLQKRNIWGSAHTIIN